MVKKIAVVIILFFGLIGCEARDDVGFARNLLKELIGGRYSARSSIDWSSLKMLESNIAAEYNKLPNEKEKIGYERGFIENFSKSFKEQKAGFNKFTNWRMLGDDKDPRVKVVACDGAGKDVVFLFYIAHDGRKRKLIDFKIVVPKAEWDDLLKQKGAVDNVEKQ